MSDQMHDVGGILLERPFKIRRLGHFGFNCTDMDAALPFYRDLLGFLVSDALPMGRFLSDEMREQIPNSDGYFMRYGTDHHAFALYNARVRNWLDEHKFGGYVPGVTINQITWQVGSLAEVVHGHQWFEREGQSLRRAGRDMPGSNWHSYLYDPDGHINELYYGIEQVGWSGRSKPHELHVRGFQDVPELPQIGEQQEVTDAIASGVDMLSGARNLDECEHIYDVDGILLGRPFKITKMGPVRLFVSDLAAAERFYRDTLGFRLTEEVHYEGHRCLFLRVNNEHHSLALYPIALREELGLSSHTTSMAIGMQVATYRQLRDATRFLVDAGVKAIHLPPELFPGLDYVTHVLDPDGHVIELYYYMEQVARTEKGYASALKPADAAKGPECLDAKPDVYQGEVFMGPWG